MPPVHVRLPVHAREYEAASTEENCAILQAVAVSDAVLLSADAFLRETRRYIDPFHQRALNRAFEAATADGARQLGMLLAHSAKYKTSRCGNELVHIRSKHPCCRFKDDCLFFHSDEDSRRDPLTHFYEMERRAGCCASGNEPDCPYAHSANELDCHPVHLLRRVRLALVKTGGSLDAPTRAGETDYRPPLMRLVSLRLDKDGYLISSDAVASPAATDRKDGGAFKGHSPLPLALQEVRRCTTIPLSPPARPTLAAIL
jgi:hypothetical protein